MKIKNITVLLTALVAVGMQISCSKDFLNRPPQSQYTNATYYQTDDQVLSGTAPLYSVAWKDYCDKANWKLGDGRAGVISAPNNTYGDYADISTFQVTGISQANIAAYSGLYEVIGQANTIADNILTYSGSNVTPAIKNHALGECRFMRAAALSYLVMNYGPVPIIDDNSKYLEAPAVKRNTVTTIWEFIIKDLTFAKNNLMTQAPSGQTGRLTRWSAEALLARTYLNIAGLNTSDYTKEGTLNQSYLDSAKYYSDRVINLSGKQMLADYATLFKYPYNNNSESLFELEWVYTAAGNSYQYANTMMSQISPDPLLSAAGDGWGGAWASTLWTLSLYDSLFKGYTIDPVNYYDSSSAPGATVDQRLQASFMLPGFQYPEFTLTKGDAFISQNAVIMFSLYYSNWNKAQSNVASGKTWHGGGTSGANPELASIKKYVVGNLVGNSASQDYPNDIYMMRLAEMYLVYAEASVLNNTAASDAKALDYFNVVHQRAGLPALANSDSLTSKNAWYYVFKERVKEFAMEGMTWYDLVRRYYYNQQQVIDILQGQDRGLYQAVPNKWNYPPDATTGAAPTVITPYVRPTGWSFYKMAWYNTSANHIDHVTVDNGNFYIPIPQAELVQAPSLSDAPVDYVFN